MAITWKWIECITSYWSGLLKQHNFNRKNLKKFWSDWPIRSIKLNYIDFFKKKKTSYHTDSGFFLFRIHFCYVRSILLPVAFWFIKCYFELENGDMESASAFLGVLGHQPWENSWRIHVLPTQFQVSNSNDKKDRKFSMGLKWFTGLKSHMINCLPHDLDMRFHALWSLSLTGSFFFLAFLSKKKDHLCIVCT